MAGDFQYIEVVPVVQLAIFKGPVFGFESVKEEEFLFHLTDHLKDQLVIR